MRITQFDIEQHLESRAKEVVSIMMNLFDEEEIVRTYKSERCEAAEETKLEKAKKAAIRMIKKGKMYLDDIAEVTELLFEVVKLCRWLN